MQGPVYLIEGGTFAVAAAATLLFRDSVKAKAGLFSTMLKILCSWVMLLPKMWFNHISHAQETTTSVVLSLRTTKKFPQ